MTKSNNFKPVLIANRGEIATRIARTAKRLGFPTIAVYSEPDRFSEHVKYCDKAYPLGGNTSAETYLDIKKLIQVAQKSGAKYIHPGYGFLSEKANFVRACKKADLIFVGPSAASIALMGDKIEARIKAKELKIPLIAGTRALKDPKDAIKTAKRVGFPILLKAKAGGGGKGMRIVNDPGDFNRAFEAAAREATAAFGDSGIYIEKLVMNPHHVEVQIFGDGKGNAVHLGERECSIQRQHQKIIEETPAPVLQKNKKTREALFATAIKLARAIKYSGAGTVEFIVNEKGEFFFLEMNTRLQVEHTITEWVTGIDLVEWQLLLAADIFQLPKQNPTIRGAAIEARIYAEDPHTFLPAPGKISDIVLPAGPFVRSDSALHKQGEISIYYDALIAKLSTWGANRKDAIERMNVALQETMVQPPKDFAGHSKSSLKTNLQFLRRLMWNDDFRAGHTPTSFIENAPDLKASAPETLTKEAAIATSLFQILTENAYLLEEFSRAASPWAQTARKEALSNWEAIWVE